MTGPRRGVRPPGLVTVPPTVDVMDNRDEIRDFLTTRRARITPEQAGLPAYGGNRRVAGLRREEVAMLAGVSVDYYTRLERGNLRGASGSVLEALAQGWPAGAQVGEGHRRAVPAFAGGDCRPLRHHCWPRHAGLVHRQ
jgi:hypothetical protein